MSDTTVEYFYTYNEAKILDYLNLDTTNIVVISREELYSGIDRFLLWKTHEFGGDCQNPEFSYDNESIYTHSLLDGSSSLTLSLEEE